jgi:SsrA-binding protein
MKIISINKKAKHDYFILETFEAGIVLNGNEIKSIRKGSVDLKGSFCRFFKNELFVLGMFINKYESANTFKVIDEKRNRKLLLKRKELNKIEKKISEQGLSIVPIKIYINDKNKCKLEIAIVKGKKNFDKRNDLKEKTIKRDIERSLK